MTRTPRVVAAGDADPGRRARAEAAYRRSAQDRVRVNDKVVTLARAFEKLKPADFIPTMRATDSVFRRLMERLYDTEGASGGGLWAPLSPAYKAQKDWWFGARRRGYAARQRDVEQLPKHYQRTLARGFAENKILQLTGRLKRSLTTESNVDHIAQVIDGSRASFVIQLGTNVEYAQFHAEGGPRLPVRNPVKMTEAQKREVAQAAIAALKDLVVETISAHVRGSMAS